jgi:Tol biopolymer transport system component
MKTTKNQTSFVLVLLAFLFVIGNNCLAQQSAGEIFEKALYLEEAQGNLQKAIELYQQILEQFPKAREIAAKAQLHIGLCYEKLGLNEAPKAYQKVLDDFPDQIDAAKVAQEKLSNINKAKTAMAKDSDEFSFRKVWEGMEYGSGFFGTVSPDGRYLSSSDWDGDLTIKDLATGKSRRLTHHNETEGEKGFSSFSIWSPDSKKIAHAWEYTDGSEVLELVDLDGSKPKILYREKGKYIMPYSWAPDGKNILVSLARTLYLISSEDGAFEELKTFEKGSSPLFMSEYRFSPDGKYLAFDPIIRNKNARQRDIVLLTIAERTEFPLVKHPAQDFVIGWSPDNKYFLFGSDRDGSVGIYAQPFGNGKVQGEPVLVKSGLGPITALGISEKGSFFYGIWNDFMDIYTVPLEFDPGMVSQKPHRLGLPFEGYNQFPQYSPDGDQLVYTSMRGSEPDHVLCIYSFKTGQTDEFNLGFSYLLGPQWSPDGKKILFTGIAKGTKTTAIYQLIPDTGEVSALTPAGVGKAHAGRWSPDGGSIFCFDVKRPGSNKPGPSEFTIVRYNLDNKNEEPLWKFNSANTIMLLLDISPDGEKIAFVQRDAAKKQDILWTIPASGGTAEQVLVLDRKKYSFDYFVWTADGQHILFSAEDMERSVFDLMRISADGNGEPERFELGMTELWCFDIHPNGKSVVFHSGGKTRKNAQVWVMENFLQELKSINR